MKDKFINTKNIVLVFRVNRFYRIKIIKIYVPHTEK